MSHKATLIAAALLVCAISAGAASNNTARVATEAYVTAMVSRAESRIGTNTVALIDSATNGAAVTSARIASNAVASAVAPLVSTQQLAAAISALPPAPAVSADALRLVDSTNSPARWIGADKNIWTVRGATNSWHLVVPERGVDIWFPTAYTPFPNTVFDAVEGVNYFVADGWELAIYPESYYDPPNAPVQVAVSALADYELFDPPAWVALQADRASTNLVLGPVNAATNNAFLSYDYRPAATSVTEIIASVDDLVRATNALIQTYLITSNAWITANTSNATISVSLVGTNGLTNTVSVGGNNSIDPQATNLLWQALSAGLAAKAPKAWGSLAPDGSTNPDPDYMTWLNAPATVFASGCSWSTYGTYAVLTSSGSVAFETGSNGVFRVGPDSTNYFGYAVGGSVTVGAVQDSIRVYEGGTSNGYAEIVYMYDGGDFPAVWFSPALGVDFSLITPVWVDNLDGTATVTVPATTAKGFYRGTTSATFDSVFESTMPARFVGGVMGATNAVPVIYNSTVNVLGTDGHTYRIPARFVE